MRVRIVKLLTLASAARGPFFDGGRLSSERWASILLKKWELACCRCFGPKLAYVDGVIAPTSFTDFGWPTSALSSAASNAVAASAANDQTASTNSFQDILAQAVTPDSPSPASSTFANSVPINSATPPLPLPPAANPSATPQTSSSVSSDSTSSARSDPKASSRPASPRGAGSKSEHSRTTSAKTIAVGSTLPAAHTDDQNTSDTAPTPGAAESGDASSKGSKTGNVPTAQALPATATTALGGAKNLAGAAFAMHITPGSNQADNANNATAPASNATPGAPAANDNNAVPDLDASGSAASPTIDAHALTLSEIAAAGNPLATVPVSSLNAAAAPTAGSDAPASQFVTTTSETSEISDEDAAGAPQTVRTVQVQLMGEGDSRVDLRMVEHSGGLSVSVRSSDSELTKGLQDNLPELSSRLAAEKYDTHTLVPPSAEANDSGSSTSDSSSHSSGQSQQQSSGRSFSQGDSASGGNGGGNQQGGSQDQPANWWRQLAALGKLSSATNNSLTPSLTSANSTNSD